MSLTPKQCPSILLDIFTREAFDRYAATLALDARVERGLNVLFPYMPGEHNLSVFIVQTAEEVKVDLADIENASYLEHSLDALDRIASVCRDIEKAASAPATRAVDSGDQATPGGAPIEVPGDSETVTPGVSGVPGTPGVSESVEPSEDCKAAAHTLIDTLTRPTA